MPNEIELTPIGGESERLTARTRAEGVWHAERMDHALVSVLGAGDAALVKGKGTTETGKGGVNAATPRYCVGCATHTHVPCACSVRARAAKNTPPPPPVVHAP